MFVNFVREITNKSYEWMPVNFLEFGRCRRNGQLIKKQPQTVINSLQGLVAAYSSANLQ